MSWFISQLKNDSALVVEGSVKAIPFPGKIQGFISRFQGKTTKTEFISILFCILLIQIPLRLARWILWLLYLMI
jgi:hypothetical protein